MKRFATQRRRPRGLCLAALTLVLSTLAAAQPVVPWNVETQSIPSTQAGDVAIVTTNGGLVVGADTAQNGAYGYIPQSGQLAQVIPLGALKSVDARGPFLFVTTVNSGLFAFFDGDAGLEQLNPTSMSVLSAGFVALRNKGNFDFTLHITRTASVQRWDLHIEDGGVQFTNIDQVTLPQVPSGVAVDDRNGNLFIAMPLGVMLLPAPNGGTGAPTWIGSIDGGQFGSTMGGIALLPLRDGGVFVLTTNPQAATVVAHEFDSVAQQLDFLGAVAIGAPDGGAARAALPFHIDTTLAALPGFPRGLVAVQDGTRANYKLVSLEGLDAVLQLPPLANEDGGPDAVDSGTPDAGATDGGASDGGTTDGGGPRGGGTGGAGGSGGNNIGDPIPPRGCSCGDPLLVFLPAMLLLWWIRRPRFS